VVIAYFASVAFVVCSSAFGGLYGAGASRVTVGIGILIMLPIALTVAALVKITPLRNDRRMAALWLNLIGVGAIVVGLVLRSRHG
jgi:hypothetical protein